jgi:hypothetical protein
MHDPAVIEVMLALGVGAMPGCQRSGDWAMVLLLRKGWCSLSFVLQGRLDKPEALIGRHLSTYNKVRKLRGALRKHTAQLRGLHAISLYS